MMIRDDPFTFVKCVSLADSDSDECFWAGVEDERDRLFEWKNSRFSITLASGPTQLSRLARAANGEAPAWDEYIPRVNCQSECSPLEVRARCKSKYGEQDEPYLFASVADDPEMYYTPEEAPEAVRVLVDEALYAVEACRFIKGKVEELYPHAELFDSHKQLDMDPKGVAGSFDGFHLMEEAHGDGWSRMVWRNSRFFVCFYEPGEGLLHIGCRKADPNERCSSPRIIARPQLIGAYLEPLLFIDLSSPKLWCIETAEHDAERLVAETGVAVKICQFMRYQVGRYYPEYLL